MSDLCIQLNDPVHAASRLARCAIQRACACGRGCEYVVSGASDEVGIESARLQAFAAELDPEDVRAAADQALPRLPIRFDGLQSEVRCTRVSCVISGRASCY